MIVLKSLGEFGILNSLILIFYKIFEMTDKVVEISLATCGLYDDDCKGSVYIDAGGDTCIFEPTPYRENRKGWVLQVTLPLFQPATKEYNI
jgi:hypothetical protein